MKKGETTARKGKVLIGAGIVTFMPDASGCDVLNIGIDVPVPIL